ncbi:MAG: phage holin family protein [Bacteroidetes bacterium]|nr:MAG: phage holin family protein [Bacteroidota bacterium]
MLIIVQILILTFAVLLTSYLLPGITVKSFWTALLVAIVLALLNAFVKPVMVLLTIPFTLWTFGLFLFVINALIILLAGALVKGFEVKGFWWALIFSIILSIVQYLLEYLILPSFQ